MLSNKNYVKGRRFEYRVKEHLEKQGWIIFRCAGSKPVDLIAFKFFEQTMLIECKAPGARLPAQQRNELMELAARCGAMLFIATSKKRAVHLERLV